MAKQIILAIETSCDDTCCAILENGKVLAHVIYNQNNIHAKTGGIVPESASRIHFEIIDKVINEALTKAKKEICEVDFYAATTTPGLAGSLFIGKTAASTLAKLFNKKFIEINHLYAHAYSPLIDDESIELPALAFVLSGGHTSAYLIKKHLQFEEVSHTTDDAIGECLDKVGKSVNFPYPAGVYIDKHKDAENKVFLSTQFKLGDMFSFSGLKTKLVQYLKNNKLNNDQEICSLISNTCINNYLLPKMDFLIAKYMPKSVLISGGVSANSVIRKHYENKAKLPKLEYTVDNAAMIGKLAYFINLYNN